VNSKAFFVLSLMVLTVFSLMSIDVSREDTMPAVYVFDPVTQAGVTRAGVGENFTVDVRVRDVQHLMAFEFYMQWNDTLLQFIRATEGPFLNSTNTYQSIYQAVTPGSEGWPYSNKIYVVDSIIAATESSSPSGSGTLARVTFKVLVEGSGILDLQDSILVRYSPYAPPPTIDHTSEDGYFTTASLPRVVVEPAEVVGTLPGESFSVNITALDVLNVYNWTVAMKWREIDLLNATEIVEGSFLSEAGATDFKSTIDQDNGVLYINNTLTGAPLDGVSGSGTLANITFIAEIRGKTDLELLAVKLYKQDGSISPVAVESGSFSNTLRDVSITEAMLSADSVTQGQKVNITVTVKNNGWENETFTVRVDFDGQAVEPAKKVNKLVPNATQTLIFHWDTSNVEPKEYTLKALIVETIPGETAEDRADNTRTIGTVRVSSGSFDFNLLLIGGAIAAVVVVALAFFFVKKRK